MSSFRSREREVELWMQDVAVQERLGGRVFNLARSYLHRYRLGGRVFNLARSFNLHRYRLRGQGLQPGQELPPHVSENFFMALFYVIYYCRFLNSTTVNSQQLQLLAAACLLLRSGGLLVHFLPHFVTILTLLSTPFFLF